MIWEQACQHRLHARVGVPGGIIFQKLHMNIIFCRSSIVSACMYSPRHYLCHRVKAMTGSHVDAKVSMIVPEHDYAETIKLASCQVSSH